MARISVATDDFNRAGPTLGANWSQRNSFYGDIYIDSSTRFRAGATGQEEVAAWVGAGTITDDQYASVKIVGGIPYIALGYAIGVACRISSDTDGARDYYCLLVNADGGGPNYTTELFKIVNGTKTTLHSAASAWADGDLIELECEGTTIRACRNGAPLGGSFTATDSSLATGAFGIAANGGSFYGDDFEGGNLGAAAPASNESYLASRRNRPGRGPYSLGRYFRQRIDAFTNVVVLNDIVAVGSLSVTGSADINATGGLSAVGAASITGVATLDAAGALDCAGSLTVTGAAALDAVGSLTAAGTVAVTGTASLDATGALSAAGAVSITGAADLNGAGGNDLAAAGSLSITGSAILDATGVLIAAGTVAVTGVADISATGALAAAGTASITGLADLTGTTASDMSASGSLSVTSSATLSAVGALIAHGTIRITGVADLAQPSARVTGGDDVPRRSPHTGWNRRREELKRSQEQRFLADIRAIYRELTDEPELRERAIEVVAEAQPEVRAQLRETNHDEDRVRIAHIRRRTDELETSLRLMAAELVELRETQELEDERAIQRALMELI